MSFVFFKRFFSEFFCYETNTRVYVTNYTVGLILRILQASVLLYSIFYVMIYCRGYQSFDIGIHSNMVKVKGAILGTTYNNNTTKTEYFDVHDIVIPPKEKDAFFISTTVYRSYPQKKSKCTDESKECNQDNICFKKGINNDANGILTGQCIGTQLDNVTYCEKEGWCPLDSGKFKRLDRIIAGISDLKSFTVFIKSYVWFSLHKTKYVNIPDSFNKSDLKNCRYDENHEININCPIFNLYDVILATNSTFDDIFMKGAIIAIQINWDCEISLFSSQSNCLPKYSFERIDGYSASPGYNFRYTYDAFKNSTGEYREIMKLYGIKFVIVVDSISKKFDIVNFFINTTACIGLLTLCNYFCDAILLNFTPKRSNYTKVLYPNKSTNNTENTTVISEKANE